MNIDHFYRKYSAPTRPIEQISKRWENEAAVYEILSKTLGPGYVLADVIAGDMRLIDGLDVSNETKDVFKSLMGESLAKGMTPREMIIAKASKGDAAFLGFMNKIQGELGETQFLKALGGTAGLASSKSQAGWDIWVDRKGATEYFQVKVYRSPSEVIADIKDIKARLANGTIFGKHGEVVHRIDIAVNSDILEQVREKVKLQKLNVNVRDIGKDYDTIRNGLSASFDGVLVPTFEAFLSELLGGLAVVSAIQTAVAAFQMYVLGKCAKDVSDRSIENLLVNSSGLFTSFTFEYLATKSLVLLNCRRAAVFLASPYGACIGLGVGLGTRALTRRVLKRRHVVGRLKCDIASQLKLEAKFKMPLLAV